jgi:hypothetical protein
MARFADDVFPITAVAAELALTAKLLIPPQLRVGASALPAGYSVSL